MFVIEHSIVISYNSKCYPKIIGINLGINYSKALQTCPVRDNAATFCTGKLTDAHSLTQVNFDCTVLLLLDQGFHTLYLIRNEEWEDSGASRDYSSQYHIIGHMFPSYCSFVLCRFVTRLFVEWHASGTMW